MVVFDNSNALDLVNPADLSRIWQRDNQLRILAGYQETVRITKNVSSKYTYFSGHKDHGQSIQIPVQSGVVDATVEGVHIGFGNQYLVVNLDQLYVAEKDSSLKYKYSDYILGVNVGSLISEDTYFAIGLRKLKSPAEDVSGLYFSEDEHNKSEKTYIHFAKNGFDFASFSGESGLEAAILKKFIGEGDFSQNLALAYLKESVQDGLDASTQVMYGFDYTIDKYDQIEFGLNYDPENSIYNRLNFSYLSGRTKMGVVLYESEGVDREKKYGYVFEYFKKEKNKPAGYHIGIRMNSEIQTGANFPDHPFFYVNFSVAFSNKNNRSRY